ncbi:hypothetical protein [Vibrio owensii]|uniref:hypothetical protein n=1 Tax=Vibrio harveyi group TaxID=717610 RepID=UPI003CC5F6B0
MNVIITNDQRNALKKELIHVLNTHRNNLFKKVSEEIKAKYPSVIELDYCEASRFVEGYLKLLSSGEKLLGSVTLSLEPGEIEDISVLISGTDEEISKFLHLKLCKTFY